MRPLLRLHLLPRQEGFVRPGRRDFVLRVEGHRTGRGRPLLRASFALDSRPPPRRNSREPFMRGKDCAARRKADPHSFPHIFFESQSRGFSGAAVKRNGETNFFRALGRLAGVFANASAGPFSGVCECPHALCRGDPLHSHALLSNLIHPKHRCVYATFASENRLLPLSALCVFDAV